MFSRTWWLIAAFVSCELGCSPRGDDTPRRDPPEAESQAERADGIVGEDGDGDNRAGAAALAAPDRATRGNPRDFDTLVIGRATDAIDLDPAVPTDAESAEIIEQIFDKLVHYRNGEVVPGLAISWRSEAGGKEWLFELRKGVRFHDGTPMDADEVVFSLERQRNPKHPYYRSEFHYWRTAFANVQAIEKEAAHWVRITLERPYAPFLANMAMYPVSVVSPAAAARPGHPLSRHPVGSGPFRFVSWQRGRIVLERNDDYWGSVAKQRRLVFQTIGDPRQRLVALESGAIDIAYSILPEELPFVELHPRLELYRTEPSSITYLALNMTKAPLTDVKVRQAINYAINKEPIVKVLWHGMAIPAYSPLAPSQWGHYVDTPYTYDPERARGMLAEAAEEGRFDPGKTLRLYVTSTSRPHLPSPERLGRAIEANLRDIGIDTEMVSLPFGEFLGALQRGEHDMAIYGWVSDNGDPDNVLYVLFDRNNAEVGRASNVAFYRDPEVHGLLVVAQESEERAEREALYARVQALLREHAPWVPLAHSRVAVAARRDIAGVVMTPTGMVRYQGVFRQKSRSRRAGGR